MGNNTGRKMNKQQQGKTAKRNGKAFEKKLEDIFAMYKEKLLCNIEKTPEPYRYIKPYTNGGGGLFVATFSKSAQPDFKGTLSGGRAVVLEAKSVHNDRFNLAMLTDTELKELIIHDTLGAISGVLVYGQESGFIYFFPCSFIANMQAITGYKHIKLENAEAFIVNETTLITKITTLGKLTASQCKLLLN